MQTNHLNLFSGDEVEEAFRIIRVLADRGFTAYLAGGCVRDALLGKRPKDYDVATNATPETVREIFGKRQTLAFGASFGVIGVLPPRGAKDGTILPTEVATFRSDGQYSDGRRPDQVVYGNAQDDAMRRDFTINGLFYDPHQQSVIDYVGGQEDLRAKILRTIGSADQRFDEDRLRMLRAIRFATTTGFAVDAATMQAIQRHAGEIDVVSGERIGAEMRRVMTSPHAGEGLKLLVSSELSAKVLPEMGQIDLARASSLLMNLARRSFPAALGCIAIAADQPDQLIAGVSDRWRLSTVETRQARAAVRDHDLLIRSDTLAWSIVQPKVIDRDVDVTLAVAEAVVHSEGLSEAGIRLVHQRRSGSADQLNPPPLITGDDLREAGYQPGPKFRVWLESLRAAQLDGQITSVSAAWQWIKDLAQSPGP